MRFRRRVTLAVAAAAMVAVLAAANAPVLESKVVDEVWRLWIVALGAAAAILAPAGVLVASTSGVRVAVSVCGRWLYEDGLNI